MKYLILALLGCITIALVIILECFSRTTDCDNVREAHWLLLTEDKGWDGSGKKKKATYKDLIYHLRKKRNTSAAGSPGWHDCSRWFPHYILKFCEKHNARYGAVMVALDKKTPFSFEEGDYSGVCYVKYSRRFLRTRLPIKEDGE